VSNANKVWIVPSELGMVLERTGLGGFFSPRDNSERASTGASASWVPPSPSDPPPWLTDTTAGWLTGGDAGSLADDAPPANGATPDGSDDAPGTLSDGPL
jgi:hypothetical protein